MRGRKASPTKTYRKKTKEFSEPVEPKVIWSPQPKQSLALGYDVVELFYGGARGGGKSDFLLADFLNGIGGGKNYQGVMFRRSYGELEELQKRAWFLYKPLGGDWAAGVKTWTFPGGETLKMRFLESDADVHRYHGHQYQWIGFDELTNWPTDYCYTYMFTCLRSAEGIKCYVRSAGNPGHVGHQWVKKRFIDCAPPYTVFTDPHTGVARVFVPALLDDNLKLMENNPTYADQLKMVSPHLYAAYRWGDWSVFEGQEFDKEWLMYWEPDKKDVNIALLVDPASQKKVGSHHTAMWVVGIGSDDNWYVFDCVFDKLNLTERANKVFELHRKWNPRRVGYEQYGMQSDIEHIKYVQEQQNYRFAITPLRGNIPKHDRIKKLIPILQAGRLYLPHRITQINHQEIRENLIDVFVNNEITYFPVKPEQGDFDMLDCLARICDPDMAMFKPKALGYVYDLAKYRQADMQSYVN